MELKVFWHALRRRWYLALVVLALTIGATWYVATDVGPTYEAEGSALVFPPASSTRQDGVTTTVGNPYLELAGVSQARDVIIRALKSRTVQTEWEEQFPGASYEVTPDFTNSAPIILFTVEADRRDTTTAGLDDLMARVPPILSDLQDGLGLAPDDYVTARKLTQDARPELLRKDQIRSGLVAAAATGGLGLLLLALVDSLLGVRARSRAAEAEADDEPADEPDDEPLNRAADEADDEPVDEPDEAPDEAPDVLAVDTHADPEDPEDPENPENPADSADPAEPDAVEGEGEPEREQRPGRPLVDSALAVSPARSRWVRDRGAPADVHLGAHWARPIGVRTFTMRPSGRTR